MSFDDIGGMVKILKPVLKDKEKAKELFKAIDQLPPKQKIAFTLNRIEGLSYQEISEITQLGVGNVGFLIHTGLKKLRHLWPQNLEVI